MGSCALVALIVDNKLYSANIGDCKGFIISVQDFGSAKDSSSTNSSINNNNTNNSSNNNSKGKGSDDKDNISNKDSQFEVKCRKINHKQNAGSKKEQ